MHINELPREMLEEVLSYLTIKEKFQCEQVCRQWQRSVFVSIHTLSFLYFNDVFLGYHNHKNNIKDVLPYDLNKNDVVMKYIITKCGKYVRSFRGAVSYPTMLVIAKHCQRLQCIDMLFDNAESIKVLADTFGKQLTCATLYTNLLHGINSFLSSCLKLSSLAVIHPRCAWTGLSDESCTFVELSDLSAKKLPLYTSSVRNLVLDSYITPQTLDGLLLFNDLRMANICFDYDINKSSLWSQVLTNWSSLTSLSLQVYGENFVHFEPLPPNLHFLSLSALGNYSGDPDNSKMIKFSSVLPKLQSLEIYRSHMTPAQLSLILDGILRYCPSVRKLGLGCEDGLSGIIDEQLASLLVLTSIEKLNLGKEFTFTDSFASKLIHNLDLLTSIGECMRYGTYYSCETVLPCGPLFWKALCDKAKSHPSQYFNLIGVTKEQLHLQEPIPSNLSLCLTRSAKVSLSNGFGSSLQWQRLVNQWDELYDMNLEIQGTNLHLSGLPKYLDDLNLRVLTDVECESGAFTLHTSPTHLRILTFYQNNMSNQSLQTLVDCLAKCCPNLSKLSFDRGNTSHEATNSYLSSLLSFQDLHKVCFSENFIITHELEAEIVSRRRVDDVGLVEQISDEQRELHLGPLIFISLLDKVLTRKRVVLRGGPNKLKVIEALQPMQVPKQVKVKKKRKTKERVRRKVKSDEENDEVFDLSVIFN